ncbi:MAG: bifunctional oligoribonuclease/PAP phosphatase NrnA [Acidobacteria bacterium]|nr:bifunctional oligoribonuclease/PAP phosphatase NrnA [Acidobacteriota bacterium]
MTPDPLARITAALLDGERFVLASHVRPDGDSIGSQLALAHALRALGKTARIVNHDAPPAYLRTLPGADGIEVAAAVNGRFDAAVVLECGTLERTEVVGLDRQPVVNIDHHAGNAMYGALNWFDPTAAACAEMVHDLIAALGVALTPDIGAALYAGILTDTGSFRHANITARTFETCRNAAACGVDAAALAAAIYQNSSLGKLRLTGRLLNEMRLEADGRIAVLRIDEALLRETGCPPDDMEGVINLPLAARDVEAVIMFRALDGVARVSLRSKGLVDVRAVAAAFGGGGHRNAAGCTLDVPGPDVESRLLARTAAAVTESGTHVAAAPGS